MGLRHKYNAIATTIDGKRFPSKKHAQYYAQLQLRVKAGEVLHYHREVIFDLPGGITYRVDFQEFLKDYSVQYVEVKGFKTKEYLLKKKLVESTYPHIQIVEV